MPFYHKKLWEIMARAESRIWGFTEKDGSEIHETSATPLFKFRRQPRLTPVPTVSHYDWRTRTVILLPDATPYTRFHEIAHSRQHAERMPLFLAWLLFHRLPVIGRWLTIRIEVDAFNRASAAMCGLGLWDQEAELDALRRLTTYFRS